MLVMIQLLLLLAYESLWPDAWHFLSIFSGSAWLMTLLWLNFGLMVNRIVQRVIFVTGYYGLTQGPLSVLRLFWGNLINFMANWRALKQVLQHGDPRRVAWDKTTHDFPSVTGDTRSLRPLGQILLENQVITEEQLDTALRNRVEGLRLGGSMLMQGLISAEQLAQALAEQNGVAWESIDAWQIPSSLIAEMPASVALHYAVLPLRLDQYTILNSIVIELMYAARGRQKSVHWKFQSGKLGIRQPVQLFNDTALTVPAKQFHPASGSTASAAAPAPAPAGCRYCRASSAGVLHGQSSWSLLSFLHPLGLHSGASHFSLRFISTEGRSGCFSRNPGRSLKPMLST